ncbi:MAG: class I SAM-dependent methyltransferase [Candidatus Moraniibacteriota bacterium]
MKEELVKKILKDTEIGYELISEKFSQTRNRFWGELEFIKKFTPANGQVLDFGCGNGRLVEILLDKDINYVGVDVCENLINAAKKNVEGLRESRKIQFLKIDSDFKKLPFPSEYFDSIYSIAVFHHLPSATLRLEVMRELYRLLKKDGFIIVTVWNLWQPRYRKNIFKNWKEKIFKKSALDFNDCYVSFTNNQGQRFDRFHHAFTTYDLANLLKKSGFNIIECRKIKGNILVVAKK